MTKFKYKKWTDVSMIVVLLGACINFWTYLQAILFKIEMAQATITAMEASFYVLTINTSNSEQYQLHFIPLYVVSIILAIYAVQIAISFFKYARASNNNNE